MTTPNTQPEPRLVPGAGEATTATATAGKVLVDTHVHLYDDAVDALFDRAAQRFQDAAGSMKRNPSTAGCLMLTETARDQVFESLLDRDASYPWRPEGPALGSAVWMRRTADQSLLVIAGGQTVTAEGVEVLSLGTRERFADGQPIDTTIERVLAAGALPVLPYGLGKWIGKRGRVVAEAFERYHERGVRLGDNAGRPAALPDPPLFATSTQFGLPVLPGSDPLRTGRGRTDAGRYGVVIEAELDTDNPADTVRSALRALGKQPATFGRRVGLARCVTDQLALRVRKHLG